MKTKFLNSTIQNVCLDIAHQLSNIPYVISTCLDENNQIPLLNASPWNAATLSYGYPALICCFSEINHFFPDQKWNDLISQCVEQLVEEIKTRGVNNSSLFSGYAGICFALDMASQERNLYPRLRLQLHSALIENVQSQYLKPIQHFLDSSQPVYPYLYDTIAGVVGILAYLLNHATKKETHACITDILRVLIKLTERIEINGMQVPGWFISSKDLPPNRGDMSHILGVYDTGLAHGISGCLAILAKASLQGVSIPGQVEAMERIVLWLQNHRTNINNFKEVWPSYFHLQDQNEIVPECYYRDGWCYGAPGIIISLFLASCALKDSDLYNYAVDGMHLVCKRFTTQNTLSCPTICHGLSGLLAIVHQMYLATKSEIFLNTSFQISEKILEQYNPDSPFRFKTDVSYNNKQIWIDNPGLLDGSTGIVLSLLFQLSDRPRPWLPIFLMG